MKRTAFSGAEKWLLTGGVLAAVLVGGGSLALSRLKNALAIPPRAAAPRPNGFDLYVAAATALRPLNPPVDALFDTQTRSPQEAVKFYTPARRAAFVSANLQSWNSMQAARAAQTQHPGARASFGVNLPSKQLRQLARAKTIEAKHFKDGNRWNLALQSGLDTFEMGRDIEQGAPVIGSLIGIAIEAIGGASIEDVPPHLSAIDAKNGARRLEKIIAGATSPAEVLREEKWILLTQIQNNFGQKPNLFGSLINGRNGTSLNAMMDEFIAQSEKPFALQTVPPVPTGYFSRLSAIMHPVPARYGFNVARRDFQENRLLLRLALRAYRVENRSYPDNLAQLAPQYLAKLPRDPFGRGEGFRYRKSGDSYLAWSIGPDGRDDGGAPIPIKAGKKRVVILSQSLGDAIVKP